MVRNSARRPSTLRPFVVFLHMSNIANTCILYQIRPIIFPSTYLLVCSVSHHSTPCSPLVKVSSNEPTVILHLPDINRICSDSTPALYSVCLRSQNPLFWNMFLSSAVRIVRKQCDISNANLFTIRRLPVTFAAAIISFT
jgi:hypothetical protein